MRINVNGLEVYVGGKQLIGELSNLHNPEGQTPNGGVTLLSQGSEANFKICYAQKNERKEIVAWKLEPTPETNLLFPSLNGWTMYIYNC